MFQSLVLVELKGLFVVLQITYQMFLSTVLNLKFTSIFEFHLAGYLLPFQL